MSLSRNDLRENDMRVAHRFASDVVDSKNTIEISTSQLPTSSFYSTQYNILRSLCHNKFKLIDFAYVPVKRQKEFFNRSYFYALPLFLLHYLIVSLIIARIFH